VRSFSGHRAPFRAFSILFPFEASTRLLHLRCSGTVGGAGLQLRQGKNREYISYSLSNKVIEWKPKWFYVENQLPFSASSSDVNVADDASKRAMVVKPARKFGIKGLALRRAPT